MKRPLLFFTLSLVAVVGLGLAGNARAARAPLVLAFYYNWFDENTWKPDRVPDLPASPYTSRDAGAIARQIQQARGAGIDAFVVSWWGVGNPTDDNFRTMLDQARAANFQAAVDFELTSPFYGSKNDVIRSLKTLLTTRAQHPAYLRVEGKPVVFFWREQKYSVDEWRAIRNEVDPNRQSLWIAEGVKEQLPYLAVFDGLHLYSIAWAKDVTAELQKWRPRVKAYGADKLWVATVMPGNDDTRTRRSDAYVRDRRGGEFYRETWRAAFSTYPDWIIITSWNEWVEGTMIEPSVSYGNLYLDITREFAARFKAGLPTPTSTATPPPSPPQIGEGRRGEDEGQVGVHATISDTLRVRAEPSTAAVILGRVREGVTVTLLARTTDSRWWQIAFPNAKQRGWIAAEFTKPAADTDALPIADISVTPTPTLTIEATPTLTPTETPVVEIATPTLTPTAVPPTATPTPTPTSTPAPVFSFPLLKRLFPFLP